MSGEKNVQTFKQLLKESKHYSEALIDFLLTKLEVNQITTFQQINDLIYKDTNSIINHFSEHYEDLEFIQRKNPLCLESMRDYLLKIFRVVARMSGQDVKKIIENLKIVYKTQVQVLSTLTQRTADTGLNFIMQHQYKSILVYNYSKSIAIALKQLSKIMGENLEVYICSSGLTGEGEKMYNDLSMAQVNCSLVAHAEAGYYINEVDCILTGAEVVLSDGSIINRTGTTLIALSAADAKKPLIVFAECYKFLKKTLLTQKDIPNFARYDNKRKQPIILTDLTKSKHISLFCTDVGCIAPEAVSLKISTLFS